jgi:hypothetical protein
MSRRWHKKLQTISFKGWVKEEGMFRGEKD